MKRLFPGMDVSPETPVDVVVEKDVRREVVRRVFWKFSGDMRELAVAIYMADGNIDAARESLGWTSQRVTTTLRALRNGLRDLL